MGNPMKDADLTRMLAALRAMSAHNDEMIQLLLTIVEHVTLIQSKNAVISERIYNHLIGRDPLTGNIGEIERAFDEIKKRLGALVALLNETAQRPPAWHGPAGSPTE
jgi:hypothetical protein